MSARSRIEIDILGPLRLRVDGATVPIGSRQERALLAVLALRTPRTVSTTTLSWALWGDAPPATAHKALQVGVSKLRRKLPSGTIETVVPGYRLALDPDDVDVLRFTKSVREAGAQDDPVRRASVLTEALGLWYGEGLDDLGAGDFGRNEAARLADLRRIAEEQRFDALLALNHDAGLIVDLQEAVDVEPLREERWALLMIALYRSGRRADALRTFQRLRRTLGEIGVEPGPRVRELELRILRDDPELFGQPVRTAATVPIVGLPRRLMSTASSPFLGRSIELEQVADALTRVSRGGGLEFLAFTGEPGIGKTTLLAEAARRAHSSQRVVVLSGRGEEELALPYQLFSEAFGPYVDQADYADLARMRRFAGPLCALLPGLRRRLADLTEPTTNDREAERHMLFSSMFQLLEVVSQATPLIIVLDDLHWADQASLQLLRYLVTRGGPLRILLLGGYRNGYDGTTGDLVRTLSVLRRVPAFREVPLGGFSVSEINALLDAIGPDGVTRRDGLATTMHEETDGNPLFVVEVARDMADPVPESERTTSMRAPRNLADIISSRTDRMGHLGREVMAAAAVIGTTFDLDVLCGVADLPETAVLGVLRQAQRLYLVTEVATPPGRFEFAHPVLRRITYEELGPTRRAVLHGRVAHTLEAVVPTPLARGGPALAGHWSRSSRAADRRKAAGAYLRAGTEALAQLAPTDATEYFEQALQHYQDDGLDDPGLRLDLQIGMGVALRQIGDPQARERLLSAAAEASALGDAARLARAALENDRGYFFTTYGQADHERLMYLQFALDSEVDASTRALLLARCCEELTFDSQRKIRLEMADVALTLARSTGDPRVVAQVLVRIDGPLRAPEEVTRSLPRTAEATHLARAMSDPVLEFWALTARRIAAASVGDLALVDRTLRRTSELALAIVQPTMTWVQAYASATRALVSSDTEQAEHWAARAYELGTESGQPDAFTVYSAQLLSLNSQRGTMGTMVPLIEQAVAENPGLPTFESVLAAAYAEAEQPVHAGRVLSSALARGFDLPVDPAWLTGMVTYAEAAVEVGEGRFAEPLFALLEPWSDQLSFNDVTVEGPVAHYVAGLAWVLGRYDQAQELFSNAKQMSDRLGANCFGARARLNWARMLIERADPSDAERIRQLLHEAHRIARRGGYGTTRRRSARLLRRM